MISNKKMSVAWLLATVLSLYTLEGRAQQGKDVMQVPKRPYEINGSIKGLNSASVYLIVIRGDNSRMSDTLIAKSAGDSFKFTGETGQRRRTSLYIGEPRLRKEISFFLEPGKIIMSGNVDSLNYVSLSGTLANNELTETQRYLAPIYDRRSALSQKMRSLGDNAAETAELRLEISSKTDSVNAYRRRFMETHPASEISLSSLYVLQDALPIDAVERIYNSLIPELRNSEMGKYIYSKLQASKSVAVGKRAPDFTSTGPDGAKIKLSDFKGKYVLLEFWAHWCVPCRAQHPHLKDVYDKFKDKGFTILQYSVDVKKDEQKWKDAIKQDGLVWPQTSDLPNGQAPVAVLYGVQPIPDSFLISPDGIILGRRLNPKALEDALAKLLK